MNGALTPIAEKLRKLLPRLASVHDGEVVATARAIDRTLASAGCDYHDLVGAVAGPDPDVAFCDPSGVRRDLARVNRILGKANGLRPRETDFLHSIGGSLARGRPLTPRQSKWLSDICARAGLEYAL